MFGARPLLATALEVLRLEQAPSSVLLLSKGGSVLWLVVLVVTELEQNWRLEAQRSYVSL